MFWNQGYFDRPPEISDRFGEDSDFALDMRAGAALADRLKLFVDFLPPDGAARIYQVHGGHGWLELDPSWFAAAWTFMQLGFDHILDGIDHLLFLFCLVLPFRLRQFWTLAGIITSFTVAHSITLIAGGDRPGAVRQLVPAAGRDADRRVDRLHGGRERRRASGSAAIRPPACAGGGWSPAPSA